MLSRRESMNYRMFKLDPEGICENKLENPLILNYEPSRHEKLYSPFIDPWITHAFENEKWNLPYFGIEVKYE